MTGIFFGIFIVPLTTLFPDSYCLYVEEYPNMDFCNEGKPSATWTSDEPRYVRIGSSVGQVKALQKDSRA
ncbi:hypothetical protein HFRIS_011248 [Herbaspirillum frisingense GSF30]|uniref:Uncharacterized protein n=1 Tax=Herbaspirillum frisingense GSF30 TaxID=864073 RepID=A0AAI9IEH4_9BURK|nr:hypothetical protein HFRIS_011248 [Herbaspirillum frisingense GSF30]